MIIDYSTIRPSMATLRAAGITAVGRYIGWDGEPGYQNTHKNLTTGEAGSLRSAGIEIFLAFEYLADAPARGATQGHIDGMLANRQLADLGAPPDMCVYFAADWDVPDYAPGLPDTPANALVKLGPVGHYFQAVRALRYPYLVGVYGGYYVVKRCLDAGLVDLGWQTVAWSGGQQDSRSVLLQLTSTAPISGADVDMRPHLATVPDYGQWPRPFKPAPVPDPNPPTEESMLFSGQILPSGNTSVPVVVGATNRLCLYADFVDKASSPVVRVAVLSAAKGYSQIVSVTLGDSMPHYVLFTEKDVSAVSFRRDDDVSDVEVGFFITG